VIEGDNGIRHLQKLICNEFNVVNLFGVDECELPIYSIPNIVQYEEESNKIVDDVGTDCSLSDVWYDSSTDSKGYNSEELEALKAQKKKKTTEKLSDYKELYKGMSFKNIPEARKCIKLYSLAN